MIRQYVKFYPFLMFFVGRNKSGLSSLLLPSIGGLGIFLSSLALNPLYLFYPPLYFFELESVGITLVFSLTFTELNVLVFHAFKALPGTYIMWERGNCEVGSIWVNPVAWW